MEPIDAAGVAGLLRPGATVFVPGQHAWPRALIEALDDRPACTRGVHLVTTRAPGFDDPPPRVPGGRVTVFFRTPDLDRVEGELRFVPIQYRRLWDLLSGLDFDLVLCRLRPPDARGRCGWGPGLDFLPAVLSRARRVVAQLDASLPDVAGGGVEESAIDRSLDAETPTATLSSRDDAAARAIGAHVASLVEDGDCLQTGIGAIPDAVLRALRDRRGLGCHSGMITDGVLELVEHGALDGSRKTVDRGRVVTGFLLGSPRLYRWAERAGELLDLRPVSYTHDARVLASLDRLVAINSAVEVDLLGQVNGERVGGRQVSGTGGSVDFFRGAALSRGGRSIVALPATAAGGRVSRVVASLGAGSVATATRTDVDAVVTEHGVAWLRGADVEERAERLLGIAAPEHRERLAEEWARLVGDG